MYVHVNNRDGFAGAALFDHPTAVTVDHRGFIYVTDSRNGRIRRIAPVGMDIHINYHYHDHYHRHRHDDR